jgi:hypothetical protein
MSDNDITWEHTNSSELNKQTQGSPPGKLAGSQRKLFPIPYSLIPVYNCSYLDNRRRLGRF